MPVLNAVAELCITGIEVLKSYLTIPIVKNNDIINPEPPAHAIGFRYVEEENSDYEEDV